MRVLGVSCDFHDAAAALVVDGVVVAAAEQERFSRLKHDAGLPVDAIASVLAIGGLRPDDIDRVVLHEKPLLTLERLVAARQSAGPRSFATFCTELPPFVRRNLFVGLRVERSLRSLGATKRPVIRYAEHHLSHAAAAFYPSPFGSAAVLTVDGIGEWATATIGRGNGTELELLVEQRYPDSLGLFYSAVTELCGFEPNDGEYKLMGLAPYGEPTLVERLRELVEVHDDGSVTVDVGRLGRWSNAVTTLESLLGRTRTPRGAMSTRLDADLARSAQVVVEESVLGMARHARRLTGESRLCLAGGVALNCVANGRVVREGPFDDVWVQPAAGDAGSAVGAALWLSHEVEGVDRPEPTRDGMAGSALGPSMRADDIAMWLTNAGVAHTVVVDLDQRAELVADALDAGKFVGWFEGRMEFGPRALGHRSIVADPRSPTAQTELNVRVKGRESFRPFAPAVLAEHAEEWFGLTGPSEYMLVTAPLSGDHRRGHLIEVGKTLGLDRRDEMRSEVPACTHVDGSARVQTVPASRGDGFRALIEAFHRRTGCPMVLNTSFNVAGEPIVCTPDDAVASARRSGVDLLVLEDVIIDVDTLPDDVPRGVWAQAPTSDPVATARRSLDPLAAVAIALPGPCMFLAQVFGGPRAWAGAAVLVIALLLVHLAGPGRFLARLAVAAAAGLVLHRLGGVTLGGWGAILVLAVDMVIGGRAVVPWLPRGNRAAVPGLLALSAVSTWFARDPASPTRLRVAIAGIGLVVVATAAFPSMASVVDRIGARVGDVVARVGAALIWLPTVLLPWCANRVVRTDPLRPAGRSAGSAWQRREPGPTRPKDMWRRDPVIAATPWSWKLRRAGAATIVTAIVGSAIAIPLIVSGPPGTLGPSADPLHSNTDPSEVPAALADADWYGDYLLDISWLWRTNVAWDPLAPVRLRDVTTKYVNIEDGARRSWTPPECDCRRVTVWMYGGSTTFGLGQRDEHTIASELARAAADDGVAVDIQNRGVVGDHHWEEANRFAWDLASLPAPDMVVFLDGINDVQAVDRQQEVSRQPLSFIKDDFWRNYLANNIDGAMDGRWAPQDGSLGEAPGAIPPSSVPLTFDSAPDVGAYVAERYETARKISAAMADSFEVDAEWFWQPAIENRPAVDGEPPPAGREWSLERYRAAAANVGDEVHDISGALDGIDEPLYWDQFHTNEAGAERVGQVMYGVLRPRLRELAGLDPS